MRGLTPATVTGVSLSSSSRADAGGENASYFPDFRTARQLDLRSAFVSNSAVDNDEEHD